MDTVGGLGRGELTELVMSLRMRTPINLMRTSTSRDKFRGFASWALIRKTRKRGVDRVGDVIAHADAYQAQPQQRPIPTGGGKVSLIVPLFRGSSRFESLILTHHSRYKVTCECNEEDINDE